MNKLIKCFVFLVSIFNIGYSKLVVDNGIVDYTIALKQNNVDYLKDVLLDISDYKSPNYGKYWNKEQILNVIKPSQFEVEKVTEWLDIYDTNYVNLGDALLCKTKINDLENMFNIKIIKSSTSGYFVNSDYTLPDNMKNYIVFVEGLSDKLYSRSKIIAKNNIVNDITPEVGYAAREVINRLYNITYNKIVSNISVGAIEYQGSSGFGVQDLNMSQSMNDEDLKPILKSHVVGTDLPSDLETQLDMQMMSQTAENVDLWFWDSPQWLFTFAVNFFNSKEVPDVISMSWGWAESDQCSVAKCNNQTAKEYIDRVNAEYIKLGLRGITITVSSGDAGAPGRTNEVCGTDNPVNPVFPGSSPWITSVGGTFIMDDPNAKNISWETPLCKKYGCLKSNKEMVSNQKYTGWTSGGGFSIFSSEELPKWQKNSVEKYLNSGTSLPSNFSSSGRGYPDVTAVSHNCPVFNNGQLGGVDGTSCSSPVFASIVSLLNDFQVTRGKPKLGYINPLLYSMFEDDPTLFNDLTVGNNWCTEYNCCPVRKDNGSDWGYAAAKGWDPVYGLGSPNVGRIIEWLKINV